MKTEQMMEIYEAPQVDIIEVTVEKGFASSDPYSLDLSDDAADGSYGIY